jgi:hypothetical protein
MKPTLEDTFADFFGASDEETCCYCGKGEEVEKLRENTLDDQITTRYHESCKKAADIAERKEVEERNRRNQIAYAIDADEE